MTCTYGKTLLNINNVSLSYDGRPVLKNVNAEIKKIIRPGSAQGQVVGFLGPSGCGKTTLFRIIAGLSQPSSGMVSLNGLQRPVLPGEVGVVFQDYPLLEHRTVLSNLLLAANQKEHDGKIAHDKAIQYLEDFGITDKASLYPAQLSGGQRQRCAIIQQILCSDHFLLMDEPFSGLDLLMLERTCALIQKVSHMDELNTVIVVTHDITAAASVADHLWLMGRDRDTEGNTLPGSHIVETYDLIARDLCWHPEIITTPIFLDFVGEVKSRFRDL